MDKVEELNRQLAEIPKDKLIEKCDAILTDLCNGGKKFTMTVPPTRNSSDLLIAELIRRYKEQSS
ncbi:hypothetical protein MKJ01_05570 [Chryseobacterium sp. SSA4.19]|uniref:hypothetical protein n=1 Tax=Chryseobacterium sp. SSA4.19 TaxID=2919915 RepID=UPI001F4D9340|nr:hypothetical protein [Chryseobacterium sp. SSA4.19]MCJ8153229.1 hypothetical protein [Chryseobacterium sp. SSA4.19]